MVDAPEFERWRTDADAALGAARAAADRGVANWACFGCEQAAELAVKALLHALGRGPRGHDLEALGAQLPPAGVTVPTAVTDALRRLARFYIPARYPDAHPAGPASERYGPSDAAAALADAETVLAFVDGEWEALRAPGA